MRYKALMARIDEPWRKVGGAAMIFGRTRARTIARILIVEDEPLVAFDNEHFLSDAGYQVVATTDRVDRALTVIGEDPDLHLVLVDLSLSDGGNGLDVARAAGAAGVPVMFVTGSSADHGRDLAVGRLAKPYAARDLIAAIRTVDEVLAGKRPRRKPAALELYR